MIGLLQFATPVVCKLRLLDGFRVAHDPCQRYDLFPAVGFYVGLAQIRGLVD